MSETRTTIFFIELKVRDYELDFQGIVNNSVYMNYLEHARHEYLLSRGINISDLHENGKDLVVTNVAMRYKHSLRNGDKFRIELHIIKDGDYKMIFKQKIVRIADDKLILSAQVTGVCLYNGKLAKLDQALDTGKLGLS